LCPMYNCKHITFFSN